MVRTTGSRSGRFKAIGGDFSAGWKSMLGPGGNPGVLQRAAAAARQAGAPLGAVGQVARSDITRVPGKRATASAVSRVTVVAASAASLATSAAPLSPVFQLLTESPIQRPNISMKPGL